MRLYLALVLSALLMLLLVACTTPPPTEQQLEAYNQYAQLRATDAAASEIIAAAKATEAAAAQQIAQLTAEAAPTSEPITVTTPVTSAVEVETASSLLTTTVEITATAAVTSEVVLTATVTATATAPTEASVELTRTATVTPTLVVTATVAPATTPRAGAAVVITPTAAAVATPTPPAAPGSTLAWPWTALAGNVLPSQPVTATVAAPTATPAPAPLGQVSVTSQQANLRGGPGMPFDVIGTARLGDTLDVFGSDASQNWWQVCCVDDKPAWVSRTVARLQGDAQAVPVIGPLLPDDLRASWATRWECRGRGCKQEVCTGQSQASALRVISDRWLEVKRETTWDDACSQGEDWLTQVDRYTGQERQSTATAPLFNIWEGANPGPANRSAELAGAQLALWCTETRTQDVDQADGWTAAFEGQACYDTESGILALMQYVKRWLFTGTAGGQSFDRQYFGDYELIQQVLLETNAPLSGQ